MPMCHREFVYASINDGEDYAPSVTVLYGPATGIWITLWLSSLAADIRNPICSQYVDLHATATNPGPTPPPSLQAIVGS